MASRKEQRKLKKRQALQERAEKKAEAVRQHGGSPDDAPWGAAAEKLERALEREERKSRAAEKARREAEAAARLVRARQEAERARAALAVEERAGREREAVLQKDLPADNPPAEGGFLERLRAGVAKTRVSLAGGLGRVLLGKKRIDGEVFRELEEVLIGADVGTATTARILAALQRGARRGELDDPERLTTLLKSEIRRIMARTYAPLNAPAAPPEVLLFVGVNGSGKTTTIGKIAAQRKAEGKKVLLAAGDTFRAAAAEQLAEWATRAECDIVVRGAGADPAAVMHEAVTRGVAEGFDCVFCDTAGRLHTKTNLMEELKKIKRVIAKVVPEAPHQTLLVLDANTGQNAILQTRDFHRALELTGLIVTKLDGTARGGVVVGIVNEFDVPIRWIGVGEGIADLRPFEAEAFADQLMD